MKSFCLKFFTIFFFFTGLSQSNEKIVYLDVDFVLANSDKWKIILSNLEEKNKENITELTSKKTPTPKTKKEIVKKVEINDVINNTNCKTIAILGAGDLTVNLNKKIFTNE